MLTLGSNFRIYLALEPCDLRKSFDGLWALASAHLGEDPRQGALFVFTNRRRTLLKALYFDGTGTCVLAKRLEKGTFAWPRSAGGDQTKLTLTPQALQLLIDGVELRQAARRAWYEAPAP